MTPALCAVGCSPTTGSGSAPGVFQNREWRLPGEPGGYYREFTVATPGFGDRGARRIIAGKNGERYYTADHYRTFMVVGGDR